MAFICGEAEFHRNWAILERTSIRQNLRPLGQNRLCARPRVRREEFSFFTSIIRDGIRIGVHTTCFSCIHRRIFNFEGRSTMKRAIVLAIIVAISSRLPGTPQEKPAEPEKLGKVHFPASCTPAAQQQFDRAVAMLHSFWYARAATAFAEVAKTDPNCAMAYWGIAMNRRANPLAGEPDAAALKDGWEAIERAKAIGTKTEREWDYVAAMENYYKDWDKRDHKSRVLAYEKAMEQVYVRYPEDSEAAVFYALALDEAVTVVPADKDFARQLRAGAILEKVLAAQPGHPGALHYLIHTYDFPPLAERGLAAAQRYGEAAPSVPHALHMPSHTYSMLGMWQDSIKSNQAALAVAPGYAHALDFMVYAYLQGAQDGEAKRGVERGFELRKSQVAGRTGNTTTQWPYPSPTANPTGAFLAPYTALAAIPARYAIERGAWAEAAALELIPTTPVADAITYFARAMGAARSRTLESARRDIELLKQIKDGLAQGKQEYWAGQVEIQQNAATAWVRYAEGKKEQALKLMRSAADQEDDSQKDVAMENRLWPMRELLGEMLLALEEPGLALKEFEASLRSARNRYRGFYGAAKAAERSGDKQKARSYYEKLVALCDHADTERPELGEAKKYLTQR
jgi:tetratricopeptide (TPR) repeat protein